MKISIKSTSFYIIGGLLALVLLGVGIVVIRIGSAYRRNISSVTEVKPPGEITHTVRERITKIAIRRNDEDGCLEVTPDGAVRVYNVCGEDLADAKRVTDTRYIQQLFKVVSESNIPDTSRDVCLTYELRLTTAEGTQSVCLEDLGSTGNGTQTGGPGGGTGGGGEIGDIIEKIIEDLPPNTPTPGIYPSASPSPTSRTYPTGSPSPTDQPGISPTPIVEEINKGFMCEFTGSSGNKRPHTISNIVCSSGPTPVP